MEYHIKDIDKAAEYVIASAKVNTLLFNAPMGSGKTTLITAICKKLGVTEDISSPTFSIVNEYKGSNGIIYHFDLYRLNSIDELHDIGAEEYLESPALKLIEWPDLSIPLLSDYQHVEIVTLTEQKREIRVSAVVHR
ncbi:tRNA (adenosine(37)-N6)-threonylcarbamoyltransferase complex ATPase subunit type 1 TsaE [Nonlabens marinus]|uniref:tRNA threonylcarbamoyladenosine biosynthesis protein TsaE n=1 Tax=Nonlabens marinus S1-08 TaxID=1454201 RepID=W8VXN6_9FLAO|nr:tRNA (adenosine(37)-N6)-threonylcarbamoyltransferase complex ATPase subunit type 1 TsaE [Nonlabens marinus]BAO56242.1 ATPase YjeE, predicted to have essential role in cell wall biosynthesis [Nonlabens marinus S1-08]